MRPHVALVLWTATTIFQLVSSVLSLIIGLVQRNVLLTLMLVRQLCLALGNLVLLFLTWFPGADFDLPVIIIAEVCLNIVFVLPFLLGWRRKPLTRYLTLGLTVLGYAGAGGILVMDVFGLWPAEQVLVPAAQVLAQILLAGFAAIYFLTVRGQGSSTFSTATVFALWLLAAFVFFPGTAPTVAMAQLSQYVMYMIFAQRLVPRAPRRVVGPRTELFKLLRGLYVLGLGMLPFVVLDAALPPPWYPWPGQFLSVFVYATILFALLLRGVIRWRLNPWRHVPGKREPEPLSLREREVAASLAEGLRYQEIADRLFISPKTVKSHARSVYAKVGAANRLALVRLQEEGKVSFFIRGWE